MKPVRPNPENPENPEPAVSASRGAPCRIHGLSTPSGATEAESRPPGTPSFHRWLFGWGAAALAVGLLSVVGCATSVNDSLADLRYGDPDAVKQAIVDLGELLSQKETAGYTFDDGDREAIAYLRDIAEKSRDSVQRACALSSLARLRSEDVGGLCLAALEDDSAAWVLRLEATRALTLRPTPSAVPALTRLLEDEPNLEVQVELIRALEAAGGDEALRAILEMFLDQTARGRNLKLGTYRALQRMSGRKYPIEATDQWRSYRKERFGEEPSRGAEEVLPRELPPTP